MQSPASIGGNAAPESVDPLVGWICVVLALLQATSTITKIVNQVALRVILLRYTIQNSIPILR